MPEDVIRQKISERFASGVLSCRQPLGPTFGGIAASLVTCAACGDDIPAGGTQLREAIPPQNDEAETSRYFHPRCYYLFLAYHDARQSNNSPRVP